MPKDFQHLPWEDATELSARLSALPAFESVDPRSFAPEVLKRFYSPTANRDGKSLSEELLGRLEAAENHVATLPPADQVILHQPMRALRSNVAKFDCKSCANSSGHECRGLHQQLDDKQLAQPGLCIRVLHELFTDVITRYAHVVDQWVYEGDSSNRQDLQTRLSTRAQPESAYDRPGPEWKICGSTRFSDDPTHRISLIKLSVAIDDLDWPSLCAAYWILVHEFTCHAQQGRPYAFSRVACRPECPFFEGWMDELAQRLITTDLEIGLFPPPISELVKSHRRALLQAAHDYRSDRYGWRPNTRRHEFSADWEFGIKALEAIDEFLQTYDVDQDRAKPARSLAPLCRLSFRIAEWAPTYPQAGEIVAALTAAPAVAYRSGAAAQRDLYYLLVSPIRNLSMWIKQLKSIE